MSKPDFIIKQMEEKNAFIQLCHFQDAVYEHIHDDQEWSPLKRLLVDSDQKHLIYVMEMDDQWQYIRFPLDLWKQIDDVLVNEQDLMLVLSKTDDGNVHKSMPLKAFHKECKELILNMRQNANYGEDMIDIVEEYFAQTLEKHG